MAKARGRKIPEYSYYARPDLLVQAMYAYTRYNVSATIATGLSFTPEGKYEGTRMAVVDRRSGAVLAEWFACGDIRPMGDGETLARAWIDLYVRQFRYNPVPALFSRVSERELRDGDFSRLSVTEAMMVMGILANDPTHKETVGRLWREKVRPAVWNAISRQYFPLEWTGGPRRVGDVGNIN